MKMFLISDNTHTLAGMRLAGIEGIVVHERREILRELQKVKEMKDLGVLIITELLVERVQPEIDEMKTSKALPIIVEIPDRHGSRRPVDTLSRTIRESIGLKI
ncbi:MAG TPA: V-type ATP synthase subunit F [Atribacterota bacterium]|nr:V-type ATP synthase subunit F [Atribacterota bacterium]